WEILVGAKKTLQTGFYFLGVFRLRTWAVSERRPLNRDPDLRITPGSASGLRYSDFSDVLPEWGRLRGSRICGRSADRAHHRSSWFCRTSPLRQAKVTAS